MNDMDSGSSNISCRGDVGIHWTYFLSIVPNHQGYWEWHIRWLWAWWSNWTATF